MVEICWIWEVPWFLNLRSKFMVYLFLVTWIENVLFPIQILLLIRNQDFTWDRYCTWIERWSNVEHKTAVPVVIFFPLSTLFAILLGSDNGAPLTVWFFRSLLPHLVQWENQYALLSWHFRVNQPKSTDLITRFPVWFKSTSLRSQGLKWCV